MPVFTKIIKYKVNIIWISTFHYRVRRFADKAVSYWDEFLHTHPDYTADGSNGDVACDFYHRYKEDIKYIGDIGVIMKLYLT